MIKRSFRFGLLVGLLGGLAFALLKAFSGREEEPAPAPSSPGPGPARGTPWPRLEADPAVPAAPRVGLVPDPDAPVPPIPEATPVTRPAAASTKRAATSSKAAKPTKPAKDAKAPAKATKATAKAAKKATKKKAAPKRAWVEPEGDVCPASHPVKAKLASKIFHAPGGLSYARTRPDRCYRDDAAAEADGLRPAKR